MRESELQDCIRLALGSVAGLVLWRNNIGVAPALHGRGVIRFGVGGPGGADLIGIYRGRFVAAEIKTTSGRQTEEQRTFQQLVTRLGGEYRVLRSVDDAHAWITDMEARLVGR